MQTVHGQKRSPHELVGAVFESRRTILAVTVLFTVVAAGVAFATPRLWQSSVTIWLRDQTAALGSDNDPGSLDPDRLKTLSVNLREVIHSRPVLDATLQRLGDKGLNGLGETDPDREPSGNSDATLARLRKAIRLEVPSGSDFGSSEMFYLRVRARAPERATALAETLLAVARDRLRQLGLMRAKDLIQKTEQQVVISQRELEKSQRKLDEFVREMGTNLLDLQAIGGAPTGDSDLRRSLNRVRDLLTPELAELSQRQALLEEVRRLEAKLAGSVRAATSGVKIAPRAGSARTSAPSVRSNVGDRNLPIEASRVPIEIGLGEHALAIPASFVEAHPALDQTRRALLELQLELARASAEWTPEHPRWKVLQAKVENVAAEFRRQWTEARMALEKGGGNPIEEDRAFAQPATGRN